MQWHGGGARTLLAWSQTWMQVPVLPLSGCVTFRKLLNCSEPEVVYQKEKWNC